MQKQIYPLGSQNRGDILLSVLSHLFGGADADYGQGHGYHAAHRIGKAEPRFKHAGIRALDAAGGVEAVEARGKLGDVLVYAAGVVVAGGEAYLFRKRRKLLYKLALLRSR